MARSPSTRSSSPWTDEELRRSVEVYVLLLRFQEQGTDESFEPLAQVLLGGALAQRNDAAIRYRMRNISAVVQELGGPILRAFSPAESVGRLVRTRIMETLAGDPGFTRLISPTTQEHLGSAAALDALQILRKQLEELEREISWRGHNGPPDQDEADAGREDLKRALTDIEVVAVELRKPAPDAAVVREGSRSLLGLLSIFGKWIGGYEPDGRALRIVESHAELIRTIFSRYLELGNVRLVQQALIRERLLAPERLQATSGRIIGGRPLSRGQLYKVLNNRMYLGEIVHGEKIYPGMHSPIIEREIWDRVQAMLAENLQGSRNRTRAVERSLLAGKIVDEDGQPLASSHACKGKVRYRYYVSQSLQQATSGKGLRIPAREIEKLVCERLAELFDDPVELIATAWLRISADDYVRIPHRARELAARVRQREYELVRDLTETISVELEGLKFACSAAALAERLGVSCAEGAPKDFILTSKVRLTRSGRGVRLVDDSGVVASAEPNAALVRLIAQAHRLWEILRAESIDVSRLAKREGMMPSYLTRVLRLAFLSPTVTSAILEGKQRSAVSVHTLTLGDLIVGNWEAQDRAMLSFFP